MTIAGADILAQFVDREHVIEGFQKALDDSERRILVSRDQEESENLRSLLV